MRVNNDEMLHILSLTKNGVAEEFNNLFDTQELDIRKTHDARWLDQKCTPDVLCAVADIVIKLPGEFNKEFSSKDVWYSDYAIENINDQFNKSDSTSDRAKAEYNKFYQQNLNLLAYAGILEKKKNGRENIYKIINTSLLYYISMGDDKALTFLQLYITRVLKDSNIYNNFEYFFEKQDMVSFTTLKDNFIEFYKENTPIKGELEPKRIFTKVLNPLALSKHKKGTQRGRMSAQPIMYQDLMYNQQNFRDIYANKPKNITRQEWLSKHPIEISRQSKIRSDSAKAKNIVRLFNNKYFKGKSEMQDDLSAGKATQMHHIFPQSMKPEIAGYVENIVAITASQHFQKAHPNNNTQTFDPQYQHLLLIAKADTINTVLSNKKWDQIYSFDRFATVLKIGMNLDKPAEEYNDYQSALNEIELYYHAQ